ncbi:MAG: hypothetical protein OXN86_09235 [Chloroflexota bacterium]|nr:hypothetical protein [Chloroflexota bacterium]MDE2892671.1 hypothetical protein [Chloroflexota bacterium]
MRNTLRKRVTVQSGGRLEIMDPDLEAGERVDVLISPVGPAESRSAWQMISEGPTERVFRTARDVDAYVAEERSSWDR